MNALNIVDIIKSTENGRNRLEELMQSNTPKTDAFCASLGEEGDWEKWQKTASFAADLERHRDELAGYLCRIKLPLPVRFVADLAKVFPGNNVRMKDVDGYLCIFQENAIAMASPPPTRNDVYELTD